MRLITKTLLKKWSKYSNVLVEIHGWPGTYWLEQYINNKRCPGDFWKI